MAPHVKGPRRREIIPIFAVTYPVMDIPGSKQEAVALLRLPLLPLLQKLLALDVRVGFGVKYCPMVAPRKGSYS